MNTRSTVLLVLGVGWMLAEIALTATRRAGRDAARKDAGTLRQLNLVIYASIFAAWFVVGRGYGAVRLPDAVFWCGVAMMLAGLALRAWSILTLRQFFTVDVAIHADHRLVRAGPYRYVRHPSYTGVLLAFAGLALCVSNVLAAAVLLVPITTVFLRRIAVEERALETAFPGEYPEYAAHTARLVPGLY